MTMGFWVVLPFARWRYFLPKICLNIYATHTKLLINAVWEQEDASPGEKGRGRRVAHQTSRKAIPYFSSVWLKEMLWCLQCVSGSVGLRHNDTLQISSSRQEYHRAVAST